MLKIITKNEFDAVKPDEYGIRHFNDEIDFCNIKRFDGKNSFGERSSFGILCNGVPKELFFYAHKILVFNNEIYAYKLVNSDFSNCIYNNGKKVVYTIGKTIKERVNTNVSEDCANGINVGSLDWCLANKNKNSQLILSVRIPKNAKVVIPVISNGKFRTDIVEVLGIVDNCMYPVEVN